MPSIRQTASRKNRGSDAPRQRHSRGFGCDLSGYARKGGTVLAKAAALRGQVCVDLLSCDLLRHGRGRGEPFGPWFEEQRCLLRRCLEIGRLAVDIPIDLQGLPGPATPAYVWQLTLRPIDLALHAISPLADRIGSPVARFLHLAAPFLEQGQLSAGLVETYPAGSRLLLQEAHEALTLDTGELILSPDESDAALCAITAAYGAGQLGGQDLINRLRELACWPDEPPLLELPQRYVLLAALPRGGIAVKRTHCEGINECLQWVDAPCGN